MGETELRDIAGGFWGPVFRVWHPLSQKSPHHLSGFRTTRDLFHESSTKELGRLEAQLGALRQELEALGLRQSSADERLGLFPQQIQALRDDVSLTRQL